VSVCLGQCQARMLAPALKPGADALVLMDLGGKRGMKGGGQIALPRFLLRRSRGVWALDTAQLPTRSTGWWLVLVLDGADEARTLLSTPDDALGFSGGGGEEPGAGEGAGDWWTVASDFRQGEASRQWKVGPLSAPSANTLTSAAAASSSSSSFSFSPPPPLRSLSSPPLSLAFRLVSPTLAAAPSLVSLLSSASTRVRAANAPNPAGRMRISAPARFQIANTP